MKTIIAALDFSDASAPVLETAAKMAKAFGAPLHLVHVIEPEPTYAAYGFTPEEFPAIREFQEEARSRAEKALDEQKKKVEGAGLVETKILEGSPLTALLEYAEQADEAVVVAGTHGHGVIASMLLGSVAEGVVRKAKVPALIVPAPHRK